MPERCSGTGPLRERGGRKGAERGRGAGGSEGDGLGGGKRVEGALKAREKGGVMVAVVPFEDCVYAGVLEMGYHGLCGESHGLEAFYLRVGLLLAEGEIGGAGFRLQQMVVKPLGESVIPERAGDAGDVAEEVALRPLPEGEQAGKGYAHEGAYRIGDAEMCLYLSKHEMAQTLESMCRLPFESGVAGKYPLGGPGGHVVVPIEALDGHDACFMAHGQILEDGGLHGHRKKDIVYGVGVGAWRDGAFEITSCDECSSHNEAN